jgi:DNA-binding MarR family transcriptional regulator
MQQDALDRIVGQWQQVRPDLDPSPLAVLGRLQRLANLVRRRIDAILKPHGLAWELLDVLGTLRRAGHPFQLTPTALYRSCMLSSGAMTNRIDRLEGAGLVCRIPDPADRRGTLVELTTRGLEVVDEAIATVWATQAQLVADLTSAEQEHLSTLLRTLLLSLEGAGSTHKAPSPPTSQTRERQKDWLSRRAHVAEHRPS